MPTNELLRKAREIRKDWGPFLYHFTRDLYETRYEPDPLFITPTRHFVKAARDVLVDILAMRALRGGVGYILGSIPCVCFTEAPLAELKEMFPFMLDRYMPFGLRVSKAWLFNEGGRPVVYQTRDEGDGSVDGIKWRHVSYDPRVENNDVTWEREWRLKTNETNLLALDPNEASVIVPTASDESYIRAHLEDGGEGWEFTVLESL